MGASWTGDAPQYLCIKGSLAEVNEHDLKHLPNVNGGFTVLRRFYSKHSVLEWTVLCNNTCFRIENSKLWMSEPSLHAVKAN